MERHVMVAQVLRRYMWPKDWQAIVKVDDNVDPEELEKLDAFTKILGISRNCLLIYCRC